MLADLGTIALVIGFFLLVYGSVKYGTDILRGTVGEEAIVAAVACQGLTGATLAACKKAQPKPKPAVKPTGYGQAGTGGITNKRILTGTKVVQGKLVPAPAARILKNSTYVNPGASAVYSTDLMNRCIVGAEKYYDQQLDKALQKLAYQSGFRSIQQLKAARGNQRSGGMVGLMFQRYKSAKEDAVKNCIIRYANPQFRQQYLSDMNTPRLSNADPKSGSGFNYPV